MPSYAQIYQVATGVSLEDLFNGEINREIEYTIYAKLSDLEKVKARAVEVHRHEQWNVPIEKGSVDGKLRLRLIDDTRPTMCTKIKREGEVGVEEVETDIPMNMFRALREMSVGGYIKTRYTIPTTIRGLNWEVDVFLARGGAQHEWVKIDLEITDVNTPIPPFPFETSRFIVDVGDLSYTDRQQIRRLWEDEWLKMDSVNSKV